MPKKNDRPKSKQKSAQKTIDSLRLDGFDIRRASEVPEIEFVSTGIAELDSICRFPRKRITELYGLQGVGKTSVGLKCAAGISQTDSVLYVDVENAYSDDRARQLGVNPDNLTIASPVLVEDVVDLCLASVASFDVVIVDSIAAMIPRAEMEGDTGDAVMGLKARLMGQFMRKINKPLADSNCALIFINQLRETMEMYGAKRSTPGGHAVPYAASLRIELKSNKADRIRKKGGFSGQWVTATITKSKVGKPYLEAKFKVEF